ncbi:MAG: glutathione S-transferase family protein [Pseudomonadota bacterium]
MKIYGDAISGNCLKVKWTCDYLGLAYEWVGIDLMKGETRSADFLARNPAGQVPVLERDDGRCLAQSNAIMRYLALGSALIPADPYDAAKMDEWLFWEQYSHEPNIATLRFHMKYLGKGRAARDPERVKRGIAALALMDAHLRTRAFFVAGGLTLADIALVAYTRMADEGGFALHPYAHVKDWIARVESLLGLAPYRPTP